MKASQFSFSRLHKADPVLGVDCLLYTSVELKTRMANEELGTRIVIAGSKVESQGAVSYPKGSNFSIKNLFFHIPARRKFLKANSTELSNILTDFERIALVHPEVAFYLSLIHIL